MEKKGIRVVGYIRVSTESQAEEGMGLEIQESTIKQYCKEQRNYDLVKIYSDPGISGGLSQRPGLNELLQGAKRKEFEKVIVAKLDRLARDLYVQLWIKKELLVNDIEIFSIAEPYRGQDPMSIAMRQMVGVFAQLEKGRITERLREGRLKKFEKGGYPGGNLSLGYISLDGTLQIDPDEAEVVKMIKKWRRKMSLPQIAKKLNDMNIKTKRNGKMWYPSTVQSILKNSIYKGKIQYIGKYQKGLQEPILH